ncbi:glycosyltransferase [Salimicrobium salexigens]|uniref:Glycosyltransferase involved in cell wall bisynthesis n=1 Tax=Salimicrobium salexigens TaxID=908941 RepID=A0ABY1KVX0_9BACI|nr:glycosyltransferase [Salimicrobium salexigens]SIS82829.1 Glycosyltransferase involved in cell wall bisynthesis [Salimicrobium salexigens]
MNKTKIIIFMFSLGGGGIQKFVMNIVNNINKEKFDISVALVNKKGVYLNELPNEVKVIDLKANRVHYSLIPLIKSMNRENPDILFCIGTNINIVGIMAKLVSRNDPKLIIRQAVDLNKVSTRKINLFLMKRLYPKVDKCVVLTNTMRENITKLIKLPEDKIEVIYNSINIHDISKKKKEVIDESFINIKEPKIISVGRLTKQKNQHMLIDAFNLVLREKKSKLIIIGEGEEKSEIEAKIKENNIQDDVLMLGYKSNPYKYIYNSDIFVLPSLYEGLSNALLEALACDIPIVTTDNPDFIIKDGVNGLQATVDKKDIANKITEILTDKSISEYMKSNNKEYMNNFDISNMINRYENLFKETRANSPSS